jgi:predicted nucleic acid-binding protein
VFARLGGWPTSIGISAWDPTEPIVRKYVLDTNIYIDAIRDPDKERALATFLERNSPMTYMSAVVVQELRAGAVTDTQAKALQDGIFNAFERRGRVAAPSPGAFKECGRILAALFRQDGVRYRERERSLVNDILIAITCRESGFTLVTADDDFKTIRPHLRGFAYILPWPRAARARRSSGSAPV